MSRNLNKKLLKSSFWFSLSSIVSFIVSFLQTFFVAKFLDNYNYGLYSLLLLIMTLFESFSELGVKDALIRRKENDDKVIDTAFWVEAFRNITTFIILLLLSDTLSKIYKVPSLKILIYILSIRFLINSFKNINIFKLYTKFETKKLVFIQQIPIIITSIAIMAASFTTNSLLYIVIVQVLGELLALVFSYIYYPKKPKLSFDIKAFKEIIAFCSGIFILTIIGYLLRQVDYLFISAYANITLLGLYTLAYRITNIVVTKVAYILNNISYPLYSKVDKEQIKKYFNLFNHLTIYFYIVFSISIIFYMKQLFYLIYQNKWVGLYEMVCYLLLFTFLRMICALQGSIYKALNKVKIDNILSGVEMLIILVSLYPLFKVFGIYGVAISITIAISIRYIISIFLMKKLIDYSYFKELSFFKISLLILLSIFTNFILVNYVLQVNFFMIIICLLGYGIIFLMTLYVVEKQKFSMVINMLKK